MSLLISSEKAGKLKHALVNRNQLKIFNQNSY